MAAIGLRLLAALFLVTARPCLAASYSAGRGKADTPGVRVIGNPNAGLSPAAPQQRPLADTLRTSQPPARLEVAKPLAEASNPPAHEALRPVAPVAEAVRPAAAEERTFGEGLLDSPPQDQGDDPKESHESPQERPSSSWNSFFDGGRLKTHPQAYIDHLAELLELEHTVELEHAKKDREASLKTREELGITVSGLSFEHVEEVPGGLFVHFLTKRQEKGLPFLAISRGDPVTLTLPGGQAVEGTVYVVQGQRLGVALASTVSLPGSGLRLDLRETEATHQRKKAALEDLKYAEDPDALRLRDVLFGLKPAQAGPLPDVRFLNPDLNEFQKEAVRKALASSDVAVIHGPPGTGKTTTLVELILQAAQRGEKILATAPSNVAVDNILEKLVSSKFKVVRLGHPSRTKELLRGANIDVLMEAEPEAEHLARMRLELEKMNLQFSEMTGRRRGKKLQEALAEYTALRRQINALEARLRSRILESADIVLTTHGGIAGKLRKEPFDLVVMDEASQATEPLSWIPLLQARRAVFAGDHLQLPPTVQSLEARRRGLGRTILERLMTLLPDHLKSFLAVQYRMHPAIMKFVSEEFYAGRLIADQSTRKHLAANLPGVKANELTSTPIHFIDTVGTGYSENRKSRSTSVENPEEAALTMRVVKSLTDAGLKPEHIGVIASYAAQSNRLHRQPDAGEEELSTVDGFQGREKEAVVISLVRSNPRGLMGFILERERINVALSRARRLLILIGDSSTLARDPLYARFIAYVKAEGGYHSAFEWPE